MSMKLPWVSRARYIALQDIADQLRTDRAELKETVSELNDRLARVAEVANRVPRDRKPTRTTIPKEVEAEIKGWGTTIVRQQLRSEARQAHADGESWEEILAALQGNRPALAEGP